MKKDFIYVANFKMFLNYNQEKNWLMQNLNKFNDLRNENIIIAPTFLNLTYFAKNIKNNEFGLAAQNCSGFEVGAYTSQISVQSFAQAGCKYCIIGHFETRNYLNETNESIGCKIKLLQKNNIVPILCIGENEQEYIKAQTLEVLKNQLSVLSDINKESQVYIAYEPIWAIGTAKTPDLTYIDSIMNFIKDSLIEHKNLKVLYGGSINTQNIIELKKLKQVDGFMVGKASTDFQEFKKIILSL